MSGLEHNNSSMPHELGVLLRSPEGYSEIIRRVVMEKEVNHWQKMAKALIYDYTDLSFFETPLRIEKAAQVCVASHLEANDRLGAHLLPFTMAEPFLEKARDLLSGMSVVCDDENLLIMAATAYGKEGYKPERLIAANRMAALVERFEQGRVSEYYTDKAKIFQLAQVYGALKKDTLAILRVKYSRANNFSPN